MNVGLIITIVILVIVGFFVYTKFIVPMMSGKITAGIAEAQSEFDANKDKLVEEYYADPNRFAMFKQVIPEEEIKGIVNFMQPKSVGKTLLGSVATGITGVKKVNMDLFYMVITDKHFHILISNGENIISHTQFTLADMQRVNVEKGGRSMKDMVTEQTGEVDKLTFTYKDEEFSYNMYRMFYGYPRFKVEKNFADNGFDHIYLYDTGKMMSKEFQMDHLVHDMLYQGFKAEMMSKFHVTFPGTVR